MPEIIIEDPRELPEDIYVIFSDHTSGPIEYFIKLRTKGMYNHVMMSISRGKFVSQGNTYSEVDMVRYMKKGNRLFFFSMNNLTQEQRDCIMRSIQRKLSLPWWRKMYDWVGIAGQALGIKFININGLNYCSEDVALHIKSVILYLEEEQKDLKDILIKMPYHGHPQELFDYLYKNEDFFKRVAYHQSNS